MSSIGVFRKVEIDEKTYWVYTSPDETLALSSSDGSGDLSSQSLFSCPRSRIKFHERNLKEGHDKFQPVLCLPHFPSTIIGDSGSKSFLDSDDVTCKLPVVPLFWCNNKDPDSRKFRCHACSESMLSTSYYKCLDPMCGEMFHKECVESPLEIKHPSHPFHSLRLCLSSSGSHPLKTCFYCKEYIFPPQKLFYHCSTCDLSLHPVCAMRRVPLIIDHPKSHPHPLTFFPTQASSICNICGTIKPSPTYICIQCVFVIHEACIGFPHVIRICRHQHRISFTLSLPSGNLNCGVCRKQVDNKYGAYSCKECDGYFAYFVHSTCALHPFLWDGKELEGVPEEEDIIDDGEPFERVADGIILHPFHSHQLRLEIINSYDITTYCHACGLPISEDQFYSCLECDFIIHECCAKAPRMIRHTLFPDPLTLRVATKELDTIFGLGIFFCTICGRKGNGFFYESTRGESRIDLRCASIMGRFKYEGHEHPLFLPWNPGKMEQCQICKYDESYESMLICLKCDYIICYRCVALPYKVKYKHDSHILTICDGKEAGDEPDWCEICEGKIKYEEIKDSRWMTSNKIEKRYYKCNDYCCTALHVNCLLGVDMYIRPHNTENDYLTFERYSEKHHSWKKNDVRILLNNSVSRRRCPFPIIFKGDNTVFCSWDCIGYDY